MGWLQVADVGLSRLAPSLAKSAGGSGHSSVQDMRVVGTNTYTDPEYLRTGRFGPKSDLFSLGAHGAAWGTASGSAGAVS